MVKIPEFHIGKAFYIRRADSSADSKDSQGILACLAEAFAPYRDSYTPEGYADTVLSPYTLARRMETMTIFVAVTAEGEMVGTVACAGVIHALRSPDHPISGSPDSIEGHLRGMSVRTSWQGAGVAEKLLESAEEELRSQGCSRITLDTTLPLERAMRFYEKHGYRRSGREQDFFGMVLVEYVKNIGPSGHRIIGSSGNQGR